MNTMTLDSWCKPVGADRSFPIGMIRFRVNDDYHLALEQEEERLEKEGRDETMLSVDAREMEMDLPSECGELSDCSMRLYLGDDHRGQFHLVAHRASDGALIYTNAVMVDQLG